MSTRLLREAARALAFVLKCMLLTAAASTAFAVPVPTVVGPLASDPFGGPSRNYTYMGTDLDLAARRFVEQEFLYSGTANVYDTPALVGGIGLGPAAGTANIVSANHPYKTRMVVRRPVDPARFNGTVVVEWINTTSNFDIEALWLRAHEFFLRDGYAWVGISVQDQGISRAPNGLKFWSPARYGTLDVTDGGTVSGEGLSYDVLAQGMQAVRSVPAVLGGLPVRRVLAAGVSQSAGRLALYLNTVHPRDPVADGALLFIGGQQIRTDLSIPVIKILSETEHAGPASANEVCSASAPPAPCGTSLQPDTDRMRVWAMAGVSHSDWQSGIVRNALTRRDLPNINIYDGCTLPSRSRVADQYILAAGIDSLTRWVDQRIAPPHSPPIQMASVSPTPTVARDANGNVLGGIRLATFQVPTALDQGINTGPGTCFLNGTHIPFDKAKLQSLYPTHAAYVDAVIQAAYENQRQGFLLPEDAQELIADAQASLIGSGVICGPLCANVAQFPLNPSTSILRDQTQSYYFVGADGMLRTLDSATRSVAIGYTEGAQTSDAAAQLRSKVAFSDAIASLNTYIAQVRNLQANSHARPETANLLVGFANTLIERIAFEAKIDDPSVTAGANGSALVVEFFRSQSQQYYWSAHPQDRALLDTGGASGDWTRTGATFMAWLDVSSAPASTVPVCQFYGASTGPAEHFFTANPSECDALKTDTHWRYEGVAFRAMPLAGGTCPANTITVLRLWRPGASIAASRHRLVIDPLRAATMVTYDGWTLEGAVFCVQPVQ